jgi:hypothetical protein
MSQENVEIVRAAYEVFNHEAFNPEAEPDLGVYDPNIEVDNSNAVFDPRVYRGHDGLRELVSLWREMWERMRLIPQEFISVGEDRVVVAMRVVSVGRDDVETIAHAASAWTLHNGKVTRVKAFQSKADALEAVGLRE